MHDGPMPSFGVGDIFTSDNPDETLAAWGPYGVCVNVLFDLQNSEVEPRWHGWLIPWVAGLTLLRATGHVLAKVDATKSSKHKSEIKSLWRAWTDHRAENWVFWDFIEEERNNVVKEFEFGFQIEPYSEPEEYEVENAVYEKIELFREAVYWWRHQLRAIEEALTN